MKKKLVHKEVITKERFELEFDLIASGEQFAKMWALEQLDSWATQTGRAIDKMPRVDQIEPTVVLGVVHEGGFRYKVKFFVSTRKYSN